MFVLQMASAASNGLAPDVRQQETPQGIYLPAIFNHPTPTPTPIPDTVYVRSHRGYYTAGTYELFAEVTNGRTLPFCNIRVTGKLYNSNGALIGNIGGYTTLKKLAPQQRSPVRMSLLLPPDDISSYVFTVSGDDSCWSDYRDLTVLSQDMGKGFGAEVYGEVRNDHAQTLTSVKVVVTFYDAGGRIWYADEESITGSVDLPSGEKGAYSVDTFRDDLFQLTYTVQAQGQVQ